ncbi:hypothetical protein [Streptomyces sp. NBC_00102]|uniref:hypothetical protein n=1 Tax=Streptomyces sp. NBC_00102 TaxID=2975652 RepID=UPI00225828BC|nr:hypothetical protein [Streptomyces sp. NBC_00102]MCX5401796.1 hypothetical protein [Streptomyces sp. NBC_00102]
MAKSLPSRVECWTCSNGFVVFCDGTESDRMLLECEECMAGRWAPPGNREQEPGFLTIDLLTRPATLAEIRANRWEHLIHSGLDT